MKKKLIFVGALLVVSSQVFAQQETEIEEVTIASKIPQQLYKTGKNVTLLTAKDLEKYQGQNLTEVLQQVSGFQITGNFNNNQEPKSPKIRGGKSANVLILIDGVPMKDVTGNDYTAMDLRLMSIENVESIEVLNGASSVLYGSNATVSVINIKTIKAAQKTIEGLVSLNGGSFGTFGQNGVVRGNVNGFKYQVSGSNEKSDGLSSASGENFEKDGFEKQNIAANIGYGNEKFDVNINGGWNHHLYDYDAGAFTDGQSRGDDKQQFIGGNASFRYGKGQIVFNTRFSENERMIQDFTGNSYQDQYFYEGENFFSELFNNYKISDRFNFTVGVQHETQKMGSKSLPWGGTSMQDDLKKSDTEISNLDVFAKFNANYKGFNIDAGARMTDNSKFGNHFVYSINPYYLNETETLFYKAGYSFATAFIAPTLYQNYGTLPYTLPNFDLKPETNQTHEINFSIGKKDRTFVVNGAVFQREEKDVFAYQTNPDWTGNFINVDENTVKGFEIGADYAVNDHLKFGGNFSFAEKEKEATMLRQPKQRVNSYVEYLPFASTRISLSHQFVSKRSDAYWDNLSFEVKNVELESFNLFNLNINQKVNKNLDAFLNIGNLFNTPYTDVAGYTTKPRNYTLGCNFKF
ncbi:MAG: TonB-dependent receptor [Bergeyella sp.]